MSSSLRRGLLYAALAAAFVLHQDLWFWNDERMLLALPIGLAYHALYCLVAAALMALLVRYAWPAHLETGDE